jgi:hypothetical protein
MDDLTRFAGTQHDVRGLLHRQQAIRTEARADKRGPATQLPLPKHERGDRFVRGPIPYEWLRLALALGGKAGHLAWAIWWLVGVEQSNPIQLTGRILRDFHLSPRAARRLLLLFERAGLLRVERKRGRGPMVTLLTPQPQTAEDD